MTRCPAMLFASMIALSAAASCPATASVYYATYTGIASGVDTNGVFGTAGATLSNVAYTSTYSYDPSQFGNASLHSQTGLSQVFGGSTYGTTDPLLSASITINGHTYNQSSLYFGEEQLCNFQNYSLYDTASAGGGNYLNDTSSLSGTSTLGLVNGSLTALQSFALPSGTSSGSFQYNGETLSLNETYFAVTSSPTAVPEPASLVLLAGATSVCAGALGTCRAVSRTRMGMPSRQAVA